MAGRSHKTGGGAAAPVETRHPSGKMRKEYLELHLKGEPKPLPISSAHVSEYPLFRDVAYALWQYKHPTPCAVS